MSRRLAAARRRLPARLLALASCAACVPAWPSPPSFSWATVPVFQHLASVNASASAPFPPARLAWLAATYPVVVLEHAHAMGAWAYEPPAGPGSVWGPAPFTPRGGFIEDAFLYTAAALKAARNASLTVLYYQQITGALPYYRASQALNANPTWKLDANCAPTAGAGRGGSFVGDILPNYATYAWDHTRQGVTANFVSNFVNMTAGNSPLDGTFIDTAACYSGAGQATASIATVAAMQAAVPGKIVGFHTESSLAGANGFSAAMDYTFAVPAKKAAAVAAAPGKDTSGKAAVAWLNANFAAGVTSFAHIGDVAGGADMMYSLAVFLAGANNNSYFAFSSAEKTAPAWEQCWDGGSPTAPVFPTWCSGQGWSPDFARPLGEPRGAAAPTGAGKDEVTRAFASGTTVTVELSGNTCTIAWADGAQTVCAGR